MIFAFGDCELDAGRYELRRRGVPCRVQPQVFDLLLYLVKNRDRLVTKGEIYEAIWKERIVSESALSSRISAARRATGDRRSGDNSIRTVFGRGFRFVGPVEVRQSVSAAIGRRSHGGEAEELPETFASAMNGAERPVANRAYLAGHFACYTHAWSPAFEGKLVRGSLVIDPPSASSPQMRALYSKTLVFGTSRHRGPVTFTDHAIHLDLIDTRADSRVFLTLLCPNPPASALVA